MTVRNDRLPSRPRLLPRTGCCGRSLALVAIAAFAAPLTTAWAAAPEASATPVVDELDTIVVTARKRAENVQDVPIAVSVIGRDDLARQGTYTIQQVSLQAPTLQYTSSNPRNTALTIRGLGVSFGLANDGLEQGVGFYVDQVYNSRPAAAAFDLIDIERVEVLRGPQGTLFGRDTTGGAIRLFTKLPADEFGIRAEATVGSYDRHDINVNIDIPIISHTLLTKFTVG